MPSSVSWWALFDHMATNGLLAMVLNQFPCFPVMGSSCGVVCRRLLLRISFCRLSTLHISARVVVTVTCEVAARELRLLFSHVSQHRDLRVHKNPGRCNTIELRAENSVQLPCGTNVVRLHGCVSKGGMLCTLPSLTHRFDHKLFRRPRIRVFSIR